MKVLNFGSLNLDCVYTVDHIARPGETLSASRTETFCGGKGLNQSIALARAGVSVYHAGIVGKDGGQLLQACDDNGIDRRFVSVEDDKTGHTVIQVEADGQNCILLYGGCNRRNTKEKVDSVLGAFAAGDVLVLQNEINLVDYLIDRAYEKGMTVVLNPSPYDDRMKSCDLGKVSYLLLNEIEGAQITGQSEPDAVLGTLLESYPGVKTVLTLGREGARYRDGEQNWSHGIYDVPVVDTTAAGDTFTGYFVSAVLQGGDVREALRIASIAASIAVSRKGAVDSIPYGDEVRSFELSLDARGRRE